MKTLLLSAFLLCTCCTFSQTPTTPANETRTPAAVRSPNSLNADLTVPLCPARFHDGIARNGIAQKGEAGVSEARIKSTVPALITQNAIEAAGKTHIGNYTVVLNVVVDAKGDPQDLCLQKSAGYGLDASAAAAVRQYHFNPAQKDGKPVRMRLPIEVRFVNPNAASLRVDHYGQPAE